MIGLLPLITWLSEQRFPQIINGVCREAELMRLNKRIRSDTHDFR
jgi:hypothetical protein